MKYKVGKFMRLLPCFFIFFFCSVYFLNGISFSTTHMSSVTIYSILGHLTHSSSSLFLFLFLLFLSFQSFVKNFEGVQRFEDVHVNCVHLIWSQFYGIFSHHARITQELGGKFVVKVTFTGHAVVMSLYCIPWQRLMLLCVKGTITLT